MRHHSNIITLVSDCACNSKIDLCYGYCLLRKREDVLVVMMRPVSIQFCLNSNDGSIRVVQYMVIWVDICSVKKKGRYLKVTIIVRKGQEDRIT